VHVIKYTVKVWMNNGKYKQNCSFWVPEWIAKRRFCIDPLFNMQLFLRKKSLIWKYIYYFFIMRNPLAELNKTSCLK
jgi:hypothetical protein